MTEPVETHTPNAVCPHCGDKLNRGACATDPQKTGIPGCPVMCVGCGEWSRYTETMGLRKITLLEWDDFSATTRAEMKTLQKAWREVIARYPERRRRPLP